MTTTLTPRQLAGKLKPYGIYTKTVRIGYATPKGYELDQFSDTFDRYLPQHPPFYPQQCNISLKVNNDAGLRVADSVADENAKRNNATANVSDRENVADCCATQNQNATPKPAPVLNCDVVADRAPLEGKGIRI